MPGNVLVAGCHGAQHKAAAEALWLERLHAAIADLNLRPSCQPARGPSACGREGRAKAPDRRRMKGWSMPYVPVVREGGVEADRTDASTCCLVVRVRDGAHEINRAVHLPVGVDVDGAKHVLGPRIQTHEGVKFWAGVCADLSNRGIRDVLVVCCDSLTGLLAGGRPDSRPDQPHHHLEPSHRPTPTRGEPVMCLHH